MDFIAMKKELARLLWQKSYMEGDFTLSSGLKSDYYFDGRQSSLHPQGAWLIGNLFTEMLAGLPIAGVAGMTLGADPLITATSLAARERGLSWPGIIVRKEAKKHGTGRQLEGLANFTPGVAVALLEDVVSTAASVIKAGESIREAGFTVTDVCTVLDREMGGKEALEAKGFKLHAIFTRQELVTLAKA